MKARDTNNLYSKGISILQNIQDRHNLKRIVKGDDNIESKTEYFEDIGDFTKNTGCNDDEIEDEINFDEIIPDGMLLLNNNALVAQGEDGERTHTTLINKHIYQPYHIRKISVNDDDAVCYEDDNSEEDVDTNKVSDLSRYFEDHVPPVDVSFIISHGSGIQPLTNQCTGDLEFGYFENIMNSNNLDEKQQVAYSIICSSFLLRCINQNGEHLTDKQKVINAVAKSVYESTSKKDFRKTQLIQELCSRGAKEQLLMFLSGKAGSGKSHVIKTALAFLKKFCNNCDIPFDSDVVKVTAVTGCAAANLKIPGATTVHRAAHLTKPP